MKNLAPYRSEVSFFWQMRNQSNMKKEESSSYTARAAAIEAAEKQGEWIVGRVKKEYGNAADGGGALLVSTYDGFPDDPAGSEPLWTVIDSLAVPLYVASFERQGGGRGVVVFDDFETPAEMSLLIGKTLYRIPSAADRPERTESGEEDLSTLVGYELTDRVSGRTGIVREFYDYPGNPLLGVDFDGQEVLVPAGVIEVASVRKRRLTGDLPEGLFEL